MFKARKSQAAMEFLMTYGWAILVVLVAIGALAYFGVLSPDRFLPAKCQLPAGIACTDFRADTTGIYVVLRNGLGFDINSITVSISSDTVNCGVNDDGSGDDPLLNGKDSTYYLNCPLTSGSKFNGELAIEYRNVESSLVHIANGTLVSRVS